MIGPILSLALCGAALAAPAPVKAENKAIRQTGKYSLYGGKLVIQVTTKDGFVGYTIANRFGGKVTTPPTKIKKGSGWFLFPVSADEVWIYNGGDSLEWVHFSAESTTGRVGEVESDAAWREYLKSVPKVVVAELPARIRKLQKPNK